MDLALLVLTLGIGIAVAAPIGPINLIVMRTALERGFIPGVAAGLGSVIGDAFFGGIAAYGIRAVEALVQSYAKGLGMLGGGLLVIVGVTLARSHIDIETIRSGSQTISKRRIVETLFLTLTNPASLFGMLALFSGLGPALNLASASYRPAMAVLGVALGSLTWWIIVSGVTHSVRNRLPTVWIDRINRWTGVLIAAFGFAVLFDALSR